VSSDAGHPFAVRFPIYAIVNNWAELSAGSEPVLALVDEPDHGTCVPLFTDSDLAGQFLGGLRSYCGRARGTAVRRLAQPRARKRPSPEDSDR